MADFIKIHRVQHISCEIPCIMPRKDTEITTLVSSSWIRDSEYIRLTTTSIIDFMLKALLE